ncbi:hypothetical protein Tco_0567364 [Tanacetum coccineum]
MVDTVLNTAYCLLLDTAYWILFPSWSLVSNEEPKAPSEASPSSDYILGPEHPPSLDYVPGPEEPEHTPLSLYYVPKPEFPKYLAPSDAEAPIEDQPLLDDASPTALSSGYIADSDPEEDPDEDPEEDPADYHVDGGDDDDDESSDDDDDDDDEEQEAFEEDEEEEHLAPTDSSALPTKDPVPLAEDIEAFKTDESAPTPYASPPTPPSPPPSPFTPLSFPLLQIASPTLQLPSPPTTSPTYIPSPPLLLPSTAHKDDIPEADMPLRKRARFTAPIGKFEVGRVLQLLLLGRQSIPCLGRLATRLQKLGMNDRVLQRGRVNMLFRDRQFHRHIAMLLESESRHAREAWSHSMKCSKVVHAELQAYRAQVNTYEIQIQTRDTRIRSLKTLVATLKIPPKKRTATTTTTTPMTDAQIKALISQGVADALAEIEANITNRNGDDNHDSGTGKTLKKIMIDKYCLRGEIKKLEIELWNLKVKGTDVESYSQHFQELALMCSRIFLEESNEVEKYVGGLPDMIQGSVMASKPKKMQDAIGFATELMDKKIRTLAERQAKNKRKFKDTSRNNQNQQQPFKRNNVTWSYTTGPRENKPYGGSKPLCHKCNYHHDGQCAPKCSNYKRTAHLTRDYRSPTAVNNQRAQGANQRVLT